MIVFLYSIKDLGSRRDGGVNVETGYTIVNDAVIIELKSVRRIIKAHEVQLVNYHVATGKPASLILNFS